MKKKDRYKLHLSRNLVDDNRAWINTLKRGVRFEWGIFRHSQEAKKEDINSTVEEVTLKKFRKALNFVIESLKFTLESPSDFKDGWIPT